MTIIITIRKFIARLSMKMIKHALPHRIKTNPKTRKFTVVAKNTKGDKIDKNSIINSI